MAVFDDGDEKITKRSSMCRKSGKHFDSEINLDAMPLYDPDRFSTPEV